MRALRSEYMHWAKTRPAVAYPLASSEVPHFDLGRLGIDPAELEMDGASRHRYAPLRQAIAAKEGVTPDMVVMADGTSMANMLALAALVEPGDDVLVEHPVYEPIVAAASFLGARVRHFDRKAPGFGLDPDAVGRALRPETRLVILTNLHNPSGAQASEAELREIGKAARARGARVLVDEVYLDAGVPRPRSAARLDPAFVATSSLTKVYGLSGLRCGWILAEADLAERMWRLNELFGVAQAHPAERLSLIALQRLDEISAGVAGLLTRNRALFNAFLAKRDDLQGTPMTAGITTFPRLLRGDVDALDTDLRTHHDTSIVPGRFFGLEDHFRLGVGSPTELLEEALTRLGKALDKLAG